VKPYNDIFPLENTFIRTFSENVNEEELIWHRDKKNREIKVMDGIGWFLQYDNQLPIQMIIGKTYYIKAEEYHRILRGKNNLILEIKEK